MSSSAAASRSGGLASRWSSGLALRAAGLVVLAVVLIGFPLVFTNPVASNYGVYALIFVAAATAWNIFSGFTGYISIGNAVFFGAGAYTLGIAAKDWHVTGVAAFALLPLCAVVAGLIAVPFGLVSLRVRRHTFVVITIAVFFIFQLMAFNLSFTGGTIGTSAPFLSWQPGNYNNPFYYIALCLAVGATALSLLIRGSRFGLQLRAIRDDEERARSLGVRPMRVKLSAFVITGLITGVVGGLWFFFIQQVQPQSGFDPLFDLSVALMTFFGGVGTIAGPVLGALIIEPGQLYLNTKFTGGYWSEIILGALFLIVVMFLPRGVIPTASEKITAWRARRTGRVAVPARDTKETGAPKRESVAP
jgi:branched-chain amino acid transport system permease protein